MAVRKNLKKKAIGMKRDSKISKDLYKIIVSVVDERIRFYESGIVRAEFDELRNIVKELAEAQRRTEEKFRELAEAQR
ncbi:MAG: hypothetical protein RMJ45_08980, partial [Candidatus Calescibacterium sp.]|nr:hypothetical protein [Candidatus Calescibacterium sp.]